jgi:tetratricopeptide (TPR) repeat protein
MHLVKSVFTISCAAIVVLGLSISGTCRAQMLPPPLSLHTTTNTPLTVTIPKPPPSPDSTVDSQFGYQEIQLLEHEGKYDEALAKATALVEADPKTIPPYVVRGHIYSEMSQWDKADADYQTILQIDPSNFAAQFNRCEIQLSKKDYDKARDGFFALEKNPDWGDLASYKVFVCDLFAGHELASRSEFETFNKAGTHASYYFANATWSFYHKQPDEGQSWVNSAERIYPHKAIYFYSATLVDRGYMKPLPDDVKVP